MLKNKTKIISFFLIVLLLFSLTSVFAHNESNDEGVMAISENSEAEEISEETATDGETSQEETYKNSDVYLIGDEITVDYIVDGNLFICADTVTINSQIGGDAFILAKNLIIEKNGYVYSNLFVISNSIEIKGVAYDVFAIADSFTLSNGYVYRDLKVGCSTLNMNGIVGRNAYVDCANMYFNTDEATNGIIYGNLDYSASAEITIPESVVEGEISYSSSRLKLSPKLIIAAYIFDLVQFITFVIVIWLLCLWLTPKFLSNTNSYVGKKTLSLLGHGAIALITIPVACIVLILLQLTAGLSLFLLALYILALVLTKSLFTILANNFICSKLKINKKISIFGMLILSSLVVWGLTQLPYIGWLISFAIILLGLGILVDFIIPKKFKKESTEIEKVEE